MDIEFESVEDLLNYVESDIKNALENEVATQVKLIEQEIIDEVVYDVYNPTRYERRYDYEGLSDIRNMKHEVKKIGDEITLFVSNETKVSEHTYDSGEGEYLDEIIEYGMLKSKRYEKVDVDEVPRYAEPRPFTEETQKYINNKDLIENILRKKLDYIK